MDLLSLFKKSLQFNVVNILSKASYGILVIYASSVLPVESFGYYGLSALWLQYLFLISPGLVSAAAREIPIQDKTDKKYTDNILSSAIFFEMLSFLVQVLSCIFIALYFSGTELGSIFFYLAAFFIFQKIHQIWYTITLVRKHFEELLRSKIIQLCAGIIFFLIFFSKDSLMTLILFPFAGYLFSWLYLYRKKLFVFSLKDASKIASKLIKAGLTLQLLAIVYWIFRLSDRTIVASYFEIEAVGIYTFIVTIIQISTLGVGEFHKLLQPIIWEELDAIKDRYSKDLFNIVYISIILGILAVFLTQIIFYFVVTFISKQYIQGIEVFNILSYTLYFYALEGTTGLILNSKTRNRQVLLSVYTLLGLSINLLICWICLTLEYGLSAIAVCMCLSTAIAKMPTFFNCRNNLFRSNKEMILFYLLSTIPLLFIFYIQIGLELHSPLTGLLVILLLILSQIIVFKKKIMQFFNK